MLTVISTLMYPSSPLDPGTKLPCEAQQQFYLSLQNTIQYQMSAPTATLRAQIQNTFSLNSLLASLSFFKASCFSVNSILIGLLKSIVLILSEVCLFGNESFQLPMNQPSLNILKQTSMSSPILEKRHSLSQSQMPGISYILVLQAIVTTRTL